MTRREAVAHELAHAMRAAAHGTTGAAASAFAPPAEVQALLRAAASSAFVATPIGDPTTGALYFMIEASTLDGDDVLE